MFKKPYLLLILSLLLSVVVMFNSCGGLIFFDDINFNSSPIKKSYAENKDDSPKPSFSSVDIKIGYKSLNSDDERSIYKAILNNCSYITSSPVSGHKNCYKIKGFRVKKCKSFDKAVFKAKQAVEMDNPQIFWLRSSYDFITDGSGSVEIVLHSIMSSSDRKIAVKKLKKVVKKVTSKITPDMSEFDCELYFHDYIVNNCRYFKEIYSGSENQKCYTSYGCLVNKKAVCGGYTAAFSLLLSKVGIKSSTVEGERKDKTENIGHVWNAVKLDGKWYYVDVTWDDPSGKSDTISYDYFNLTTKQIEADHLISPLTDDIPDKEIKDIKGANLFIPKCKSDKYNYYKYKGYPLKDLDNNDMVQALAAAVQENKEHFYIYVDPSIDFDEVYKKLFEGDDWQFSEYIREANRLVGDVLKRSISFSKNKPTRSVDITLKYK